MMCVCGIVCAKFHLKFNLGETTPAQASSAPACRGVSSLGAGCHVDGCDGKKSCSDGHSTADAVVFNRGPIFANTLLLLSPLPGYGGGPPGRRRHFLCFGRAKFFSLLVWKLERGGVSEPGDDDDEALWFFPLTAPLPSFSPPRPHFHAL